MELLSQSFHSNQPKKKTEHSEEFIATNAIRNASKAEVREETLVEAEEADTNLQIKKHPDLFGVFFVFIKISFFSLRYKIHILSATNQRSPASFCHFHFIAANAAAIFFTHIFNRHFFYFIKLVILLALFSYPAYPIRLFLLQSKSPSPLPKNQ